MTADSARIAETCLAGAYDGTLTFPQIVETLRGVGFEGYAVDYRAGTAIYYRPDGSIHACDAPSAAHKVAAAFDAAGVAAAVAWAQAGASDYSYAGFNAAVMAAGCAGYLVSFLGRRVLYYGRSGETHVEHFPA